MSIVILWLGNQSFTICKFCNEITICYDDMLSLRNFYVNIITFRSSQGDLSSKKSKKTEEKDRQNRGTFGQKRDTI